MDTAYLNGAYLPLAQARIPVLDRGLLFADSVYEVIPVYAGKAFLLDAHLQRLANSLAGIRMHNPHTGAQWRGLLTELIQANGNGDMSLYLQVTRGAGARRDHRLPQQYTPNIIAFCQTRTPPDPKLFSDGVAAITLTDNRWARCEIKSSSLLANILAGDDAHTSGANEAILLRDNLVMEGASSNVFAIVDGQLQTPKLRAEILPGITRGLLLNLARDAGIACAQVDLHADALERAEEIWLTSSLRELFPVTRLNQRPVGNGAPGNHWARMRDLVQRATQN